MSQNFRDSRKTSYKAYFMLRSLSKSLVSTRLSVQFTADIIIALIFIRLYLTSSGITIDRQLSLTADEILAISMNSQERFCYPLILFNEEITL
ncbi:hypothetical protein QQG55_40070 [Brugia pahangi]